MNTDHAWAAAEVSGRRLHRRELLRLALAGASTATVASVLAACGGASATPTSAPAATAAPTSPPTATSAPTTAPSGQATSPPATAAPTATSAAAQPTSAAASPAASASPAAAGGQYPYPGGGKYTTLEPVGKQGGHVIDADTADARTNNPMLLADSRSANRIAIQFNKLVDVNPDTGLPFPDLAVEVPTLGNGGISQDGLTYTFKLRPDVTWSDGQPFTAKDVVFTYQTLVNPGLGSPLTGGINDRIASVTAPDDFTVVFKLKKIVAPFLVSNMYYIVPEHALKDIPVAQIKSHPFSVGDPKASVGTGPFKFQEWARDDHATFVKNLTYFRGAPALDQYTFKVVKDITLVGAQLRTDEADYGAITPALYDEMSGQPRLNVAKYDTYVVNLLSYQLDPAKTTLFQDKAVRQALAYALDRQAMVKAIDFGLAAVAPGTMPVISWAYSPDQLKTTYTYDPTKAARLLDQAGWQKGPDGIRAKNGRRLSFTLWTLASNATFGQYVTAMQQQWKAIGVEATPKTEDFQAFVTRISETHDFEMMLVGFAWGVDPDQSTLWATGGGSNYNKYSNKQVDELLARGLIELDPNKRKQIYIDMQNILMDELPNLILDLPQAVVGVNKRMHNLKPNAINVRWDANTWWAADGK